MPSSEMPFPTVTTGKRTNGHDAKINVCMCDVCVHVCV